MTEAELELEVVRQRLRDFIVTVGRPGVCRYCGQDVHRITHRGGNIGTYDADGVHHKMTCPQGFSRYGPGRQLDITTQEKEKIG